MKRQYGFGLIEVMLAFIIVAATAGTLLQLNKTYLEYSRDGRSREVAMRLAESKLDELRRFQSRTGFDAMASGSDSVSLDNIDYGRSWTVTPYAWNSASSAWATPPPANVEIGKKEVAVTVSWTDAGETQSFSLDSVISPNTPASGGPFGTSGKNNIHPGKGGPKVKHTPGQFPDVVAIDLGDGLKQETSKPVITEAKDPSSFSVSKKITIYDSLNNKRLEHDLKEVFCNCKKSGEGKAELPAQRTMLGSFSYWKKNELSPVSKKIGGPIDKNQDEFCTLCCKNHFDGPKNEFSHWYDAVKAKGNAHTHADKYKEACRLVRLDGSFVVASDWNLVVLNVMKKDVLDKDVVGNKLVEYNQYLEKTVINYVLQMLEHEYAFALYKDPVKFEDVEVGVSEVIFVDSSSGPKEVIVRGVYIDLLSETYIKEIKDNILGRGNYSNYESVPENLRKKLLRVVPFSDENLSDSVDWSSKNELCATVDLQGNVSPIIASGSCKVEIASIRRSNSGRRGTAITTAEESDRKAASITVTVAP